MIYSITWIKIISQNDKIRMNTLIYGKIFNNKLKYVNKLHYFLSP